MNRIKEIVIINPRSGMPIIVFRDELDVTHKLWGKSFYNPSWGALEMLRRATRDMAPDIDFAQGVITLRRRDK